MMRLFSLLRSITGAAALPSAPSIETITCDICILGAGSSGTYSAVRLKDAGKHVVVVEPNNRLGGHTETLYLPDDNYVDYGVEGVFNDEVSKNYFRRLGVEWKRLLPLNKRTDHVDFTTGERVDPPADTVNTLLATFEYRSAIKHWTGLLKGVYDLPDPVPEDLIRPFGEFVEKNSLEDAVSMVFFFAQNVGNLLEIPTLYAIQNFGVPHVDALVRGYITPQNGVYELYRQAGEILGPDVLLQTTVVETKRSDSGVELTVQHANGTRKLIKARNLLISFPPIMEKLRGFDLDETETEMFQKWFWRTYYVAVLNNTGIPDRIYVSNTDPNTGPGNLPRMPFDYLLQYMGAPGHPTSKLVGDMNFTAEDAKNLMASDFARMKAKGTYPIEDPNIVVFGDHSPETLMVSPKEIRNGYYRKLYALQGRRSTYYTGLTFCSDYSSLIWAYSDTVIGKMRWGM
ncbi:NADPH-dependent FMN reductase Lot6 [Aspergillus sclerotiicarbonarius CBS 121057]|uniref:NADPH-dependent FMN reductase Lot6 n=1 Tax=Aspergillus sclerotiicarbonarius (strain CBS 121057 / IBT 28362) TaxID=1448318 RepID=A0A319F7Z7_ASPSB|nr:NADPH-dependent FMN reductase Lot6 [Aspergillus sclerotiicarbonarius CBS 121057]